MDSKQELEIISEIRGGHREQYRHLVERYNRGLVQHIYNLINDEQSAIDDIEEAFPDDTLSLAETTDKIFTKEAIRTAIAKLPISYRQVISMYYWDGFSYEEIAEIMERPIGTIRTWLHRAKQDLKKELYGQI
jgi:RNA polymerase sigma factor (sigma-70 family)